MKKIIILTLLLTFATASFCQEITSKKQLVTQEGYLKKSKNQKKLGCILLASGAGLIVISSVISRGEVDGWSPISWDKTYTNDGVKAIFGLGGIVTMLSSVPFIIASGKNKRKANAMYASFKTENASSPRGYKFSKINYPAISFKITLN